MSPTNFVTMYLTPRAAELLREAVRCSDAIGMVPCNRMARSDLTFALAAHRQQGEGKFYLSNSSVMRSAVSGIVWTAAQSGPQELRSSFRTLHGMLEKFGTFLGKADAEKMSLRLEEESAEWRNRGCRQEELPALYEDVYKPFARAVREKADIMKHDGVDHWVKVLVGNIDVIDAFRRHEQLGMGYEGVLLGLYTALGMHHLHESIVTIWSDLFNCDFDDVSHALRAEGRDGVVDMIAFDYSFCGFCMMSEYGDDIILGLGRAADYVRREGSSAVTYLVGMEGDFASNPVAEYSRLRLLWHAIHNVGKLSDDLDRLLSDTCQKMSDLDNQLLAKVAVHPARSMSSAAEF